MKSCPECDGPLVRGKFCRACGYDGDLEDAEDGDGYLDGVDLPQGYARDDAEEERDHADALEGEGLAPPALTLRRVVFVLTAIVCLWVLVKMALGR